MAILKVSEFAETYEMNRTAIYVYRDRGKLIIIDGYIDTENELNRAFLASRNISNKVQSDKIRKESKQKELPKQPNLKDTQSYQTTEKKVKSKLHQKPDEVTLRIIQGEELKQQKTEQEIKALQIKNDVQMRKLIPREDTGLMLNAYLSRFIMNISQQTEVLVRDSLNEAQASNELIKKSCSKLVDIINGCQDIALNELENGFNNVSNGTR